jgi:glycosyltransferase involved in cell wall biosynthesis
MEDNTRRPLLSGVTFVRNAVEFDYPVTEAVRSILPIVDEYVLLVCESEDDTVALARSIADPKVRVYESDWDETLRSGGSILAAKTDQAIRYASGVWIFYLQADEVVHEDDLRRIRELAERFSETPEAQGFRIAGRKPRVVRSGARIFHYGWVRRPDVMLAKMRAFHRLWHDDEWVTAELPVSLDGFDYGPMRSTVRFEGTHPAVMAERVAAAGWTPEDLGIIEHSHDRLGHRLLGWFERNVLRRKVGEHKNFKLIRLRE